MVTVLLIRHADIDQPATSDDPPLNSAGRERAKALVHVAGTAGIAALFTSSFLRTKQTMAPLCFAAKDSASRGSGRAHLGARIVVRHRRSGRSGRWP
jgi:broad specificity phosphatase PhoE